MKRYTPEELKEVLRLHKLWLDDEEGGERANLEGASLEWANLARANLARANLEGANLEWANLARANLARANLEGAYLEGAYLEGASLAGADLTRANLTRAEGFPPSSRSVQSAVETTGRGSRPALERLPAVASAERWTSSRMRC